MTIKSSGQISLSDVNIEFGASSSSAISLGAVPLRLLAGVNSGPIALNAFYSKRVRSGVSITAGTDPNGAAAGTGFSNGYYGSMTPSTAWQGLPGVTTIALYTPGVGSIRMQAVSASQTDFNEIVVIEPNSAAHTYYMANATYTNNSGVAIWSWPEQSFVFSSGSTYKLYVIG